MKILFHIMSHVLYLSRLSIVYILSAQTPKFDKYAPSKSCKCHHRLSIYIYLHELYMFQVNLV